MAKTKAELQADAVNYQSSAQTMRKKHSDGQYLDAIDSAVAAWAYVDGMMQYERRFEGRTDRTSVECIDYVVRYAPLLFHYESLKALASLLKTQKRIDKNTTRDLADDLTRAESLMWDAHRLWTYLERESEVAQEKLRTNLGGDQDRWRSIAERWEELGLLNRSPDGGSYRLSLVTRIDSQARGKCPSCGVAVKAAMGRLLEENTCPKCRAASLFVFLPTVRN